MGQNPADKAVEDAKTGMKDHNLSAVHDDIAQIQQQDKGAGADKLRDDMKHLNDTLQSQGILQHCEIVGIDDKNHIITKSGSNAPRVQDASKFEDTDGGHHDHGLLDSIIDTVEHPAEAIKSAVEHPLDTLKDFGNDIKNSVTNAPDTLNQAKEIAVDAFQHPQETINKVSTISMLPLAAVDAAAGTNTVKVARHLEKGAENEVIHHPVKSAAIALGSAAVAAGTVLVGAEGLAAVAVAAGAAAVPLAATELWRNRHHGQDGLWKGEWNGLINDGKSFGNTVKEWGKDIATVAGNDKKSPEEQARAEKGVQQAGGFLGDTALGFAGGTAGGAAAAARGLQAAIPNAARSIGNPAPEEIPPLATPEPSPAISSKNISPAETTEINPPAKPGSEKMAQDRIAQAERFDDPKFADKAERLSAYLSDGKVDEAASLLHGELNTNAEKTLALIQDANKYTSWKDRQAAVAVNDRGDVLVKLTKGDGYQAKVGNIDSLLARQSEMPPAGGPGARPPEQRPSAEPGNPGNLGKDSSKAPEKQPQNDAGKVPPDTTVSKPSRPLSREEAAREVALDSVFKAKIYREPDYGKNVEQLAKYLEDGDVGNATSLLQLQLHGTERNPFAAEPMIYDAEKLLSDSSLARVVVEPDGRVSVIHNLFNDQPGGKGIAGTIPPAPQA